LGGVKDTLIDEKILLEIGKDFLVEGVLMKPEEKGVNFTFL